MENVEAIIKYEKYNQTHQDIPLHCKTKQMHKDKIHIVLLTILWISV